MKSNSVNDLLRELQPGRRVQIIAGVDQGKEVLDIRSTTIFDVRPAGTLTLAQTDPSFSVRDIDSDIQVTFVVGPQDRPDLLLRPARFGFPTRILETENMTRLHNGNFAPCLIVSYPETITKRTVRSFVRIEPFLDYNIIVHAKEPDLPPTTMVKMNVINLSMGGLQIAGTEDLGWNINLGDDIFVHIIRWDGAGITLLSTVMWKKQHSALPDQWRIGLKFLSPSPKEEEFLKRSVLRLQRLELRRRSGVA